MLLDEIAEDRLRTLQVERREAPRFARELADEEQNLVDGLLLPARKQVKMLADLAESRGALFLVAETDQLPVFARWEY